jgi:hypothetical protein
MITSSEIATAGTIEPRRVRHSLRLRRYNVPVMTAADRCAADLPGELTEAFTADHLSETT